MKWENKRELGTSEMSDQKYSTKMEVATSATMNLVWQNR